MIVEVLGTVHQLLLSLGEKAQSQGGGDPVRCQLSLAHSHLWSNGCCVAVTL